MPSAVTLLEIAIQGVEGLPGTSRFALRPGFNQLSGTPVASDVVTRALWATLFPDVPLGGAPSARVAVSLLGGDGSTYRLLATSGAAPTLSRLDSQAGKFEIISPEGGIPRQLGEWGILERRLFEALFLLSAVPPPLGVPLSPPLKTEIRPEPRSPVALGANIESKFAELADEIASARIPRSVPEIQARLRELEREDREANQMESLQFQLDGLQQQLFQSEDALKVFEKLKEEMAKTDQELAALPTLSEELVVQMKRLPQLTQKRDDSLQRVVEERAELEGETGGLTLGGLANERIFVVSILLGAASVAVAILLSQSSPGARYLALADIPAFGIAATMAIQRLSAVRRQTGLGRKLALLAERETRIQKAFETESREVVALMKSLGLEGTTDLDEKLAARSALSKRRVDIEERTQRAEAEDAAEGRRVARDRLRTQVSELEQQLAEFGGYRRDRSDIRKERDELKEALVRLGVSSGSLESALEDAEPARDDGAGLFRLAAEAFAMSPAMMLQTVRDRIAQILSLFSAQRLTGATFGPDGGLLVQLADGTQLPFDRLAPLEQRVALAACKLCFAERYLQGHRIFLLLDERTDGLDEARRGLIAKVFKSLSRSGQVLWFGETGEPLADNRIKLSG